MSHPRRRTVVPMVVCEPLENRQLLSVAPAAPTQLSAPAIVVPLQATATVWTPKTAAELTSALANAQLGDTIVLQAGTTYVGSFTLPNKTTGTGWLTITTSNASLLPAEGVRVAPSDAVNMARIQAPGANAQAIKTAAGAHHIKFVGIEFVGPADNSDVVTLIELGKSDSTQVTPESVPHDLVIDRCYLHPNTPNAQVRRAIALQSAYTDITNSYISDIHQEGSDSQAIAGWNGPGPFNIINNYLEAASENILFGGAAATLQGVVPSDIVIRGNYITKNLDWRNGTNGSNKFSVKNLFEIKAAQRVLMEGNILENCWTSGQTGVAIVLKLGNYDSSPWVVDQDVTIRNNIIRHANGGVTLQGRDYASNSPDGLVRRLAFVNNLFEDINGYWGSTGTGGGTFFLYLTHGPKDVTFDHNTIFNGYTMVEVDANAATYPITNFVWTNNIAAHNAYGVRSTNGIGDPVFTAYFNDPGHLFTKNILMGGPASKYTTQPGNYFPATWADVKFVDLAGGNYRLAADSAYKNAGTDGKDLGADIDAIESAVNNTTNAPPTVTSVIIGNGDAHITSTGTTLSAIVDDDGGAGNLTYAWSVQSPAGATAPSFDPSAVSPTVTFAQAGTYTFSLLVTDAGGLTASNSATVTVDQLLSKITISPANPTVLAGATQQFAAATADQFGQTMSVPITWSTTGSGNAINSSGLFTAGAAAGSFQVTATSGSVSDQTGVTVKIPSIFTGEGDIGAVGIAGSSTVNNGLYTVKGSGSDIWNTSDAFHYVYKSFSGDGQIIARVASVQNTSAWAKAGVMIRESLAANARQAMVVITSGNGAAFQRRTSTGGSSSSNNSAGKVAPYWVKLTRTGNTFSAYTSANGTSWTKLGSATIAMGSNVYIGLAVTAHNNAALNTSTFDNVSVSSYVRLSLNKTASASSTAAGSSAANALDGTTSTAWTSAAAGNQWLKVDLGSAKSIQRVTLNWGSKAASSFQLQYSSDGTTWTNFYSTTTGTGAALDLQGLNLTGRYVRINLTTALSTAYIVNELTVIGL